MFTTGGLGTLRRRIIPHPCCELAIPALAELGRLGPMISLGRSVDLDMANRHDHDLGVFGTLSTTASVRHGRC